MRSVVESGRCRLDVERSPNAEASPARIRASRTRARRIVNERGGRVLLRADLPSPDYASSRSALRLPLRSVDRGVVPSMRARVCAATRASSSSDCRCTSSAAMATRGPLRRGRTVLRGHATHGTERTGICGCCAHSSCGGACRCRSPQQRTGYSSGPARSQPAAKSSKLFALDDSCPSRRVSPPPGSVWRRRLGLIPVALILSSSPAEKLLLGASGSRSGESRERRNPPPTLCYARSSLADRSAPPMPRLFSTPCAPPPDCQAPHVRRLRPARRRFRFNRQHGRGTRVSTTRHHTSQCFLNTNRCPPHLAAPILDRFRACRRVLEGHFR